MLALGESGRFEFKSDVKSVDPKLLAALANWVALDPERDVAHLLVGVRESTDADSGLVQGVPCGLPNGLDKAVSRIQDVASHTRPIPVDAFVIEEAVQGPTPFVRVEIRPTMPPHYDDEGRRQTRQGRSTRALTDEELLRVYLDREAGSFGVRFRQTTDDIRAALGEVGTQMDEIADAIEHAIANPLQELTETAGLAASAASSAEGAAESASYDVQQVERLVQDLQDLVEDLHDQSPDSLAVRVAQKRRVVWWYFMSDTWNRTSPRANRLAQTVHRLLSGDISIDDSRNSWELAVWTAALTDRSGQRRGIGTLTWWDETAKEAKEFLEKPVYAGPNLPDLRGALQTDRTMAIEDPSSDVNRFLRLLDL